MRDQVIVNQTKFHAPLRNGLEARGLHSVFDQWEPEADLLERSLACFVSFYDVLRYPVGVWRLRRRLARHGVPLVAWNRDAPHYMNRAPWRLRLLDWSRLLDVYATHTLIDEDRRFADTVLYLPNAADTTCYNLRGEPSKVLARLRDPSSYRWDVSFFGGMDGTRYKEDAARAEFFRVLAERLRPRGISCEFREAAGMSVDQQVKFIQSSRISLNFGARCEYGAPVASGLPERCYGVPASGGFMLCDRRLHAADDFMIGRDWTEFGSLDDCVLQTEYWLRDFTAARDLAERCYHRVMNNHTYAHRAAKLHEALVAWHAGRRGLIK